MIAMCITSSSGADMAAPGVGESQAKPAQDANPLVINDDDDMATSSMGEGIQDAIKSVQAAESGDSQPASEGENVFFKEEEPASDAKADEAKAADPEKKPEDNQNKAELYIKHDLDGEDANKSPEDAQAIDGSKVEKMVSMVEHKVEQKEKELDDNMLHEDANKSPEDAQAVDGSKVEKMVSMVEHKVEQKEKELDDNMLQTKAIPSMPVAGLTINEHTDRSMQKSDESTSIDKNYEDLADRYKVARSAPWVTKTSYTKDAPVSKDDYWLMFIVGSIIVVTVWYTQFGQRPTRFNIDALLNKELSSMHIPGVGNPVDQRQRMWSSSSCEKEFGL